MAKSYWDQMTGGVDYSRNESLAGQTVMQGNTAVTYDENGYAVKGVDTTQVSSDGHTGGGGGSSGGGGSYGGSGGFSGSDASSYLKDMYAQNIAAQLASLKSTYEQNLADLEANAEKIPGIYQASRNETAAQNDVSRQAWQEYAAANGLNTGTSGQQELASSATLQRNLAEISGKESDALAANALEQKKLSVAYQNAVQQAQADGNFQLAQALYNEQVRQHELAQQMAQAAQAQKNWEAEFGFN